MLFFRIFQHLLPTGRAWRTLTDKVLRRFFLGLAAGAPTDAREYLDDVYEDLHPETTRELALWEKQFGLLAQGTEAERRLQIDAAWKAQGGQSPSYLQTTVRAAGFDVYIHEWWEPPNEAPRTVRDPRDHTEVPITGTVQCGEALAQCGEPTALCNNFLANDPRYLVNENLTPWAPPPIPSDPAKWRHFIYWGAETFGAFAYVPDTRREEFERLLLQLCPTHAWIVLLVSGNAITVDGAIVTVDGARVVQPL